MVPVKLSICGGHSGYDDSPFSSLRFYYLNSMHSPFQLLTFNLIFHIPGHFLLSRVLRVSGVLPPEENFDKYNGNISLSFENVWGRNLLLGYQGPMAERYGFLEITTLATCGPDPTRPTTFSQSRDPTRPDPTRGSTRPVDNSALFNAR